MRNRTPALLALLATALLAPAAAQAIPPPIGGLTPVAGECVTETAVGGCTTDPGAGDVNAVAVAPGGKVLYVVQGGNAGSNSHGALIAFARNAQTGALGARISCRAYDPTNLPGCVQDSSLFLAHGLAVAPDGHGLYVTSQNDSHGTLIAYATNAATGALGGPISCFEESGAVPCGPVAAQAAHGLDGLNGVAVSPDGKAVYTSAGSPHGGLAAFARLSSDGSLTAELHCASGVASPSGDGGAGKCDLDSAVASASAVAATDKAVYLSSDQGTTGNGSVVAYRRDAAAGTLTGRLNCFSETTFPGCSGRFGLVGPYALATSSDGKTLYASGFDSALTSSRGQLTTIRLGTDGSLSLVAGCLGTVAQDTCVQAPGVRSVTGLALSGDGGQLYAADISDGNTGSVSAFGLSQAVPAVPRLSCLAGTALAGCSAAATVHYPGTVAVSPDGRFVYSGSHSGGAGGIGAVQAFARELAPSCSAVGATTTAGKAVSVPLSCRDPNGDPLTLSVVGGKPAHGALGAIDQAARTTVYTPDAGYVGHDSFMYTASDGRAGTAPATAAIDVAAAPGPGPGPQPGPEPGPGPDPTPSPGPGPDPTPPPTGAVCKVPKLIGLRLAKAKKKLARAHCKLGKVRRPKHRRHGLVVVKQSPKRGAVTTKRVTVKLGKRRR